MATLSFSYDTGNVPLSRIVDAICLEYNYQANIPNPALPGQMMANPETKAQFAKRMVGNIIRNIVKNQELSAARIAADATITAINLD